MTKKRTPDGSRYDNPKGGKLVAQAIAGATDVVLRYRAKEKAIVGISMIDFSEAVLEMITSDKSRPDVPVSEEEIEFEVNSILESRLLKALTGLQMKPVTKYADSPSIAFKYVTPIEDAIQSAKDLLKMMEGLSASEKDSDMKGHVKEEAMEHAMTFISHQSSKIDKHQVVGLLLDAVGAGLERIMK